jgi:hypothetical protein
MAADVERKTIKPGIVPAMAGRSKIVVTVGTEGQHAKSGHSQDDEQPAQDGHRTGG